MKRKSMIGAFSVIETVVSMVIMAVIIGIVFIIFDILSQRLIDFRKQNEIIADLNRLTYSINKDVFESQQLISQENSLEFTKPTGLKTIYVLENDYILRNSHEFADTFKIPVRQIKVDTLSNTIGNVVYQRINVVTNSDSFRGNLRFFKTIYANELLKKRQNGY